MDRQARADVAGRRRGRGLSAVTNPAMLSIPLGICHCGCGGPTTPARQTDRREGRIVGVPLLFIRGHGNKGLNKTVPPYDETKRRAEIESRLVRDGECLIWTGTLNPYGYGMVSWHGHYKLVHILTYEWANGPVPGGLELDHLCRRHDCAEPKHLEAVTHRVNMLRGQTIAARHAAKTHCIHGHEFTPENTRMRRGARECRTCSRERQRKTQPVSCAA